LDDSSKARNKISFQDLVGEMILADLEEATKQLISRQKFYIFFN